MRKSETLVGGTLSFFVSRITIHFVDRVVKEEQNKKSRIKRQELIRYEEEEQKIIRHERAGLGDYISQAYIMVQNGE